MAETPLIDGYAVIILGEEGNMLPPAEQVATRAMGKNYGLALAETLVVKIDSVYLC